MVGKGFPDHSQRAKLRAELDRLREKEKEIVSALGVPTAEEVGASFKTARINGGMKQYQAAKLLGVTRATLSSIENGHSKPPLDMVFKVAGIFGLSLDELFPFWKGGDHETDV